MRAFVLCKLVAGLEQKAVQEIKNIPGVCEVSLTFGGWDAIVMAECDTVEKISTMILREVRGIHGVQSTETLVTTSF